MPKTKSIDQLIPDIYALFEKGADLTPELTGDFAEKLVEMLKQRFASYGQPEERRTLRMSNLGRDPLQLWYDIYGTHPVDPIDPVTRFKLLYGDIIEQVVIFLAKASGHSVKAEQESVEYQGIRGTIDCTIDEQVVDVKSVSGNSAFKFSSEESLRSKDSFGYHTQLSGYCQALGRDKGYFLHVNKDTGTLGLLEIKAEDVTERIATVKAILSDSSKPPYHCSNHRTEPNGNSVLKSPCIYCKHKHECWKDANEGRGLIGYEYSNGIKYFTKVVKEPRVEQVSLPYKKREMND